MAGARPNAVFLLFGGYEKDIANRRKANRLTNLHYMGFLPHAEVRDAMMAMDVLLMPYQKKVSIGVSGHDTADWMSPVKMFEYMAAGAPIVASRLPALEEVLNDGVDSLLAAPADSAEWNDCLDRLLSDPDQAEMLARSARAAYQREYNWGTRAVRLAGAARV